MVRDPETRFTLSGNLAATHPAKLIYAIFKAKKSGILAFEDGITKIRIYFKDGTIVPYFNGIIRERGFSLYISRKKVVTTEEIKICKKLAEDKKTHFVDELISKSIVLRADLEQHAEEYFWKTVQGLFAWRHGTFEFRDHSLKHYEGDIDPSKTLRVVLDGVRNHYNPNMVRERLRKRIKQTLRPYNESIVRLDQLQLQDVDKEFADLLMGGTSMHDALGQTGISPTDGLALAFTMLTFELVKFKAAKKKKPVIRPKASALDVAMAMASESVDRIREQIKETEEDVVSPQGSEKDDLVDKIKNILQEKEKKKAQAAASVVPDVLTEAPAEDLGFNASESDQSAASFESTDEESMSFGEELSPGDDYSTDLNALSENILSDDEALEEFGSQDAFGEESSDSSDEFGLGDFLENDDGGELAEVAEESYEEESLDDLVFDANEMPEKIFQVGLSYLDQGSYPFAKKSFNEAISRGLNTIEAYVYYGWATYRSDSLQNGFESGAAIIQQAIKDHPKSYIPYLYLGKIYEGEKDLVMAELYYIKSLELNRDCDEAKNAIKMLYENK